MNPRDLKRLTAGASALSSRASGRLAEAARVDGLLDVAFGTVDSPLGALTLAVTRRGLVRLAFPEDELADVLDELAREVSPRILESAKATQEARRELEEFFESRRTRFDLPLDRRLIRGFARDTLRATARIPFGRVKTYREIAVAVGSPGAARAVGNALAGNPIPIVIPCHRVVPAAGGVGNYGGGPQRKAALLELEASVPRHRRT